MVPPARISTSSLHFRKVARLFSYTSEACCKGAACQRYPDVSNLVVPAR